MAIKILLDTNISEELQAIRTKVLAEISTTKHPVILAAATNVLALVAYRIHTQGERANGSPIGRYGTKYLKYREGPRFNRSSDPTMIFSLTRQMENDFSVVEEGESAGLGFKNSHNADKARWLEAAFPGTYILSAEEEKVVVDVINEYLNGVFA
jgi:hypothetical protein